jgi:hypothetical protein
MKMHSIVAITAAALCGGLAAGNGSDYQVDPWDSTTQARIKHVREQGGGAGSDYTFRITGIVGQAEHKLSGYFAYADGGQAGTQVDVNNDLGLQKEKTERFGLQFQWGMLRFGGSYQTYDMSGSGNVPFDIRFGGINFSSSAQVSTDVNVELYTAELGLRLFRTSLFEIGVGVGLHYYDMTFTMRGTEVLTNQSRTETANLTAPVPVGAVWGSVFIGPVTLDPKVEFMQSPRISGIKGITYDLSLAARLHVMPVLSVGVEVGYTMLDIDAENDGSTSDNFSGDLDLKSTRISLVVGFSF